MSGPLDAPAVELPFPGGLLPVLWPHKTRQTKQRFATQRFRGAWEGESPVDTKEDRLGMVLDALDP